MVGGHRLLDHGPLALRRLDALELLLDFRNATVGKLAGALVFSFALRVRELGPQMVELGLELLRVGELLFLCLPPRGEIGGLLFKRGQLLLEPLEPLLRAWIGFLPERLLFDLEPHDLAVDRIEFLRLGIDLHLEARGSLIDQVDGLVRKIAVGDVAMRERGRRNERRVGDANPMVLLVSVLEPAQDRDRVLDARLVHIDRLETPGEGRVFLDVLLVFVESGCADTMQLAARERRLEQVGRIHGAIRFAGTDERVHLVDEQNDAAMRRDHLLQNGFQPLLELAAIFRACNQCAQIERQQFLVLQAFRHIAVDDALGEAFHDRGLADAGFADQHRIILGAPGEYLDRASNLLVAADHRIDLALARSLGEITGVFFQRVVGAFGRARVGRAALSQRVDRRVEVLRRDADAGQNPPRLAVLLERERKQEPLDRDVAVARLLRDLLRLIENSRQRRRQIDLTSAAARYLGKLGERRLHGRKRLARSAARALDQTAGQTLGVVEQNLQQVLGRELLVAL